MKTNLMSIAAALTMLLALGGCNFSSNKNSTVESTNPSNQTTQLNWTLDRYLFHSPVELASGNTLASTPADIEKLVSGLDIDIRNSAYLILQTFKDNKYYTYATGMTTDLYFADHILYSVYADKGVTNAMAKDYNDCIKAVGVERLNQGEGRECSEQWGKTWKTQVVDQLLSSSSLQNSLYEWLKPEIRRVFDGLNSDQRTRMRNALNHMIAYTAKYNHQAEKQFYRDCCNSSYGERLFVDPFVEPYKIDDMRLNRRDEPINPYRYLETWVYRRVEEGTMSASQINQWLRKIKADTGI